MLRWFAQALRRHFLLLSEGRRTYRGCKFPKQDKETNAKHQEFEKGLEGKADRDAQEKFGQGKGTDRPRSEEGGQLQEKAPCLRTQGMLCSRTLDGPR